MKHPSTREIFAHWDTLRGRRPAPERAAFRPAALGDLLHRSFVASHATDGSFVFHFAGDELCDRAGRDLKAARLTSLFEPSSHHEAEHLLAIVTDDLLPTVAGLDAMKDGAESLSFEWLLLPFATDAAQPGSLIGSLVALDGAIEPFSPLRLVSWRHLHAPRLPAPRTVRRLGLSRGLTVYEGLR